MKELPSYVKVLNGKTYCVLEGELDKGDYSEQCNKCTLQDKCTKVKPFTKKIVHINPPVSLMYPNHISDLFPIRAHNRIDYGMSDT